MMAAEEIHKTLTAKFPGAEVTVQDLTGSSDHFQVIVASPEFRGKPLIDQHQMVNGALAAELGDGRIHALAIKTLAT